MNDGSGPPDTELDTLGLFQEMSYHCKFLEQHHDIKHCISSITSSGPAQCFHLLLNVLDPYLLVCGAPDSEARTH